jgi:hypothetical protein
MTCYQFWGASVVDYVIVSVDHQQLIRDGALVVQRSPWSDHCQIIVTVSPPQGISCPIPLRSLMPPAPTYPVPDMVLDNEVKLAVQSVGLHSPDTLYGLATVRTPPRSVYLSTTLSNIGEIDAKAAFCCFWGPGKGETRSYWYQVNRMTLELV